MENTNSKADLNNNNNNNNSACIGAEENPSDINNNNNNNNNDSSNPSNGDDAGNRSRRTPFTDLNQVDADLALARTLQEQERAYMMLRIDAGDGSDYGSWETESYGGDGEVGEEDYDDASGEDVYEGSDLEAEDDEGSNEHTHAEGEEVGDQDVELDPSAFSTDEAYARALQDAEDREMAARLLAMSGINGRMVVAEDEVEDESDDNAQDPWADVDPDELSYEELIALGEVVGTESRGLSAEIIASLPSVNYKSQGIEEGSSDSCVICRLDYEDDETLTVLSCKHQYHSECINNWLQINKVCPVCSAEVSTSAKS